MKFRKVLPTAITMSLLSSISSASVVTLDFEGFAPDSLLGGANADYNYMMDGYNVWLSNKGSFWTDSSFYVENNIYPDSGSDWLAAKSISIQSMEPSVTKQQFDVISADIAEWPFFNGSNILSYRIFTSDYTFKYGEINLDGLFGFDRVVFSDDFKNINSVTFYTEAASLSYDNIEISNVPTIIPSPPTLILFTSLIFFPAFRGVKKIKFTKSHQLYTKYRKGFDTLI
jgi:hypothetical protein